MSKQTAVEWYAEKLCEILGDLVNELTIEQTLANHYAIQQAKAMEREQMIKFADDYEQYAYNASYNNRYISPMTSEQYYNETYKGGSNE